MAESKYGKYIVKTLKENIVDAPWGLPVPDLKPGEGGRIFFLDNEMVPGAFYVECVWFTPDMMVGGEPLWPTKGDYVGPHTHDFDEVICFFGTDRADYRKLNGEVEFWLEDEKHILTESCIIFVPAGLRHNPLRFLRVDKPIFHFTSGPRKMYE